MTRSRAVGNVPDDLMAEYYRQRALSAGLIITEGTSPSPNGLGYPRIPGIFSAAQVSGWEKITSAAHRKGAKIFVQLMHTGRIGHHKNLPQGASAVGPSAITAAGEMHTDAEGKKWIYHTSPFGVTREPEGAPQRFVRDYSNVKATEQGDSIRFERPTPFGTFRWQTKKSELNEMERTVWEREQASRSAAAQE